MYVNVCINIQHNYKCSVGMQFSGSLDLDNTQGLRSNFSYFPCKIYIHRGRMRWLMGKGAHLRMMT